MNFESAPIDPTLIESLGYMGITKMSPIQEKSLPISLEGSDLVACAQTGTGKTVSFLVPILNKIITEPKSDSKIRAIIIAPTRELAVQIDKQIDALSYFTGTSSLAVYGGGDGAGFTQEKAAITSGIDILVGTPGKIKTHLNLGYMDLSHVDFFVLDEADRMLDMGFREDIFKIYEKTGDDKQVLLFTATMPNRLEDFVKKICPKAKEVKLAVSRTAEGVDQKAYLAHDEQKTPTIVDILEAEKYNSGIIFTSSKKLTDQIGRELKKKTKYNVRTFHSGLEQSERDQLMLDFRNKKVELLVATDILSRGIDIEDIELVINYDVPKDPEDYVHRVGRTARANKTGRAFTFINAKDINSFSRIEKLIKKEVEKLKPRPELGEPPFYAPRKPGKRKFKPRNFKKGNNSKN